ncbi:MAG: YebC/PmpR family DNA-binding transcriptional regulator [Epsilonproteobacteria bacterium]|nr:YebC/PmpR family DNA-binding transcriptional regulator [Campylobacterota bacterium]
MAGHNKWSKIKHKKAKEDAKKGKVFTKLIREITAAAREGGGDPAGNARLRLALEKAKSSNMGQENVTRAIKKGTGELGDGAAYVASTYEGYAPHGVAVMVDTLSDNKNRTISDLRHIFSKLGGTLAESGAVAWMFERKGVVKAQGSMSEDELLEALLDYDIDDVSSSEDLVSVTCAVAELAKVRKAVEDLGLTIEDAAIEWVAKNTTEIDSDKEDSVYKFLDALDDLDDVQNVYANIAED